MKELKLATSKLSLIYYCDGKELARTAKE